MAQRTRRNVKRFVAEYLEVMRSEGHKTVPLMRVASAVDTYLGKEWASSLFAYTRLLPRGVQASWVPQGTGAVFAVILDPSVLPHPTPMPGPFDGGVDLGVGVWSEELRKGQRNI